MSVPGDEVTVTGRLSVRPPGERLLIVGDGAAARALYGALERSGVRPRVERWWRQRGGDIPAADVVVLAVSDGAVPEVAARVMTAFKARGGDEGPPILLHCAGSLPPDEAFAAVEPRPLGIGLVHPLRALAGTADDIDLTSTIFAVQGDVPGRDAALRLVARVGGIPLELGSDPSALGRYHAAAVLVSNHVHALVDAGADLLEGVGLPRGQAVAALTALLASAVGNLERVGLPSALTGPIARGDVATVARHLFALRDDAAMLQLYRVTARRLTGLSSAKGRATAEELERIRALLVGDS
jgi:predicted short-subunit dehydrogenase-like oxidoreductase (DUF2520 family)